MIILHHLDQIKAALINFTHPWTAEQAVNTTLTCRHITRKGVMMNMLANSCLFTPPADTELHYHSFGVVYSSNI